MALMPSVGVDLHAGINAQNGRIQGERHPFRRRGKANNRQLFECLYFHIPAKKAILVSLSQKLIPLLSVRYIIKDIIE